jgi:hypothetical protein
VFDNSTCHYGNLRFYCPLNGGLGTLAVPHPQQSPPTDNKRQGFTSKSLQSSSTYNRLNYYIPSCVQMNAIWYETDLSCPGRWINSLVRLPPGHGALPDAQPYACQPHRAERTRGEGIRRLTSGQTCYGLFRFLPGLGNPPECSLGVRSGPLRMRVEPSLPPSPPGYSPRSLP